MTSIDKNVGGNKAGVKFKTQTPSFEVCNNENSDERKKVHLNIKIAQKMIRRFLVDKQMTMEQLAKALSVDAKSLEKIFSLKASVDLISEVSLPLIKLYCSTDWSCRP